MRLICYLVVVLVMIVTPIGAIPASGISLKEAESDTIPQGSLWDTWNPSKIVEMNQYLNNSNSSIRELAAESLAYCGFDIPDIVPLVHALHHDNDSIVRFLAALALGRPGQVKRSDQYLLLALNDSNSSVREAAISALRWNWKYSYTGTFIRLLRTDKDPVVRATAAEGLDNSGSEVIDPLIDALKDESPMVRSQAAKALGRDRGPDMERDTRPIEPLVSALKDESPIVRQNAAKALYVYGFKNDSIETEMLIQNLNDSEQSVRYAASEALGQLKDVRAVEPLVKALENRENDYSVRWSAISSLGFLHDRRAIEPLIQVMEDTKEDSGLRSNAVEALGLLAIARISDPLEIEALKRALNDEDSEVRSNAAYTLGILGFKVDGNEII